MNLTIKENYWGNTSTCIQKNKYFNQLNFKQNPITRTFNKALYHMLTQHVRRSEQATLPTDHEVNQTTTKKNPALTLLKNRSNTNWNNSPRQLQIDNLQAQINHLKEQENFGKPSQNERDARNISKHSIRITEYEFLWTFSLSYSY